MAVDREKVTQAAQKFVEKKRYDKAVEEFQKILAERKANGGSASLTAQSNGDLADIGTDHGHPRGPEHHLR